MEERIKMITGKNSPLLSALQRPTLNYLRLALCRNATVMIKNFNKALRVANDNVEVGSGLVNGSAMEEQQVQFLLRLIKHHREVVTKRT